jgi:hypothetical protein
MISGAYLTPVSAATATASTTTTTSELNVNINSIDSEIDQLVNIRGDQSISSSTKESEEISTQQNILNQVITISTNEISTIQAKLNSLPTFATNSKEFSLQSNYLAELSSYSEYFTKESAVVANAVTLSQLQTVAANIKAFRDAGYNSEIYNMTTFCLLYYDADIISTAQSRLNSVLSDLATLDKAQLLLNPSELNVDANQVTQLIAKASTLHDQASQMIIELPDSATTTTSTAFSATSTPRTLIEKSINDIKSAYGYFIQISSSIKTQLDY